MKNPKVFVSVFVIVFLGLLAYGMQSHEDRTVPPPVNCKVDKLDDVALKLEFERGYWTGYGDLSEKLLDKYGVQK
mgnify:CR=1 FL=1